jgi:hypothetical protein
VPQKEKSTKNIPVQLWILSNFNLATTQPVGKDGDDENRLRFSEYVTLV